MCKYFIGFSIICACLLCSYKYRTNQQSEKILTAVVHLMGSEPDSANSLLNTLCVKKLNDSHYYRFILLKVRVKDKLYLNAAEDTIAFRAMNYFFENDIAEYKSFSCFVSARVEEERNNQEKAMAYYLEAVNWLDESSNFLINGDVYYNLARLLCDMKQHESSLSYLKKGQAYYDLANCNYDYLIHVNELTALNYHYLQEKDSFLLYSNMALAIAINNNDTADQIRVLQNMAVMFRDTKEYNLAKNKCLQSIALADNHNTDDLIKNRLFFILATIYDQTGLHDSTGYYLYKSHDVLSESDDFNDQIGLYQLLSSFEENNKNPKKALFYNEIYSIFLNASKSAEAALLAAKEKRQDHTFHTFRAERAKAAEKRLYLYTGLTLLCLLLLFAVLLYKEEMKNRAFKKEHARELAAYYRYIEQQNKDKEKHKRSR